VIGGGAERLEGAVAATALVVLGVALIAGAIAHGIRFGTTQRQVLVVAAPGVLLLLGLVYVIWSSLRAEAYRTVARWVFGGFGVFGGGVAGVLFLSPAANLSLGLATLLSVFFAGSGSVGGLLVGVKSVQAVQEARRAEEARTSALLFAAERDRLTHLSETSHELIAVDTAAQTATHLAAGLEKALMADCAVWLTDRAGELGAVTEGASESPGRTGKEAFETGTERVVTLPDGKSRLYVPLAGYGVLAVTRPATYGFDERTCELVRVYARTGQSALEREAQQRELERQNERLDQFASVVSHDLRNPLSVIKGRGELAIEEGDVRHVEPVLESTDRMHRLVDDLLALARDGQTATERRPVNTAQLVEDAWRGVDTRQATLNTPTRLPVLEVDPEQFQRLFENLFRNAVEHGGPNVTVEVRPLGTAEGVTGVAVDDDGPGIPPEKRDTVFERGYTTGGNGLGLAIVDDIVRGHGGTIVATEAASGGARFEIRDITPDATLDTVSTKA
jgi:K+-sensing histidine kinase KdpD